VEEPVVVAACRTAVGTFGGSLKAVSAVDLAEVVLQGLLERLRLSPSEVDEVVFGHGYPHGCGLNVARLGSQKAGYPVEVPAYVVIKACGSSLKAIELAAQAIATGSAEAVVAGGVENMSQVPHILRYRWGQKLGNGSLEDALLADGLYCTLAQMHMGATAENVAKLYGVSRAEQDEFALNSHQKALAACEAGRFEGEIAPVAISTPQGEGVFRVDESIRADTSLDRLGRLPAVFIEGGTVTAGNSCPLNDGSAAVLIMSSVKAASLGIRPIARIRSFAAAGVPPDVMGIAPVPATRKALKRAGLALSDIDLIELNEAFAAQSLVVISELGLDSDRVNVNGGAIALGHPVGATGAKLTTTLLFEMRRRGVQFGLVTLCMAGGQGLAVVYELVE